MLLVLFAEKVRTNTMKTFLVLFLAIVSPIFADFVVPALPSTPVYDEVGLLKPEEKTGLEQQIISLEQETHHQIGIAIVASLQGRTKEEAGIAIARTWGIGQK